MMETKNKYNLNSEEHLNTTKTKKQLEQLKRTILTNKNLDDLILALFYSTNQSFVVKNRSILYVAFEILKHECNISLLNNLTFQNRINPWSDELDEAFGRLEISELLPYIIRSSESWYFLDWSRTHQEQSYLKFNEDEKKQITNGALILKKLPQPIKY